MVQTVQMEIPRLGQEDVMILVVPLQAMQEKFLRMAQMVQMAQKEHLHPSRVSVVIPLGLVPGLACPMLAKQLKREQDDPQARG
jgi:hypothetical protein